MTPGKLVVGFGDPAVNFANGKVRGSNYLNPKGYEVDLAAAIAKGLGLTPKYVYTPWAKLFAPGHKSFDISFQEATITAQREEDRRLHALVLRREPGRAALEEGDGAALDRRPEEAADLRADRHDRPDVDPAEAAPGEGAARSTSRPPPRSSRCRSAGATRSSSTRRSSRPRRRRARPGTAASAARSSRTSSTAPCCRRARS